MNDHDHTSDATPVEYVLSTDVYGDVELTALSLIRRVMELGLTKPERQRVARYIYERYGGSNDDA